MRTEDQARQHPRTGDQWRDSDGSVSVVTEGDGDGTRGYYFMDGEHCALPEQEPVGWFMGNKHEVTLEVWEVEGHEDGSATITLRGTLEDARRLPLYSRVAVVVQR